MKLICSSRVRLHLCQIAERSYLNTSAHCLPKDILNANTLRTNLKYAEVSYGLSKVQSYLPSQFHCIKICCKNSNHLPVKPETQTPSKQKEDTKKRKW